LAAYRGRLPYALDPMSLHAHAGVNIGILDGVRASL
jgi:hypothetical protein